MLMPADAIRLKVPFDKLSGDSETFGIGGSVHSFVEEAIVIFSQPNVALHCYYIQLDIMSVDPAMMDYRSLLGRDILDRWRLTYDPTKSSLRAQVRSADYVIDLKNPPAPPAGAR
jgi:hypothetical protein